MFLAHEFSRKGRKITNMKAPSSSFISGSAQLWFSDPSDLSDLSENPKQVVAEHSPLWGRWRGLPFEMEGLPLSLIPYFTSTFLPLQIYIPTGRRFSSDSLATVVR